MNLVWEGEKPSQSVKPQDEGQERAGRRALVAVAGRQGAVQCSSLNNELKAFLEPEAEAADSASDEQSQVFGDLLAFMTHCWRCLGHIWCLATS